MIGDKDWNWGMTMETQIDELLAEVKRLREELSKAERKRDKYSGALDMALEHLGYAGADHEEYCREGWGCNVYGDDLKEMIE